MPAMNLVLPDRASLWRATALAAILLLGLAGIAAPARAQTAVQIESLQVDLWPEFDQPSTLVILQATLSASVPLPAEVTLRIPAVAKAPHAVAVETADGNLMETTYTVTPTGDDLVVTLTTDRPNLWVEYYDPTLAIDGDDRSYLFSWTTDNPVAQALVLVQQPSGASRLTTVPASTSNALGKYGLNYYAIPLGALAAGQTISVEVGYTKTGRSLSSDVVGVTSPLPVTVPGVESTDSFAPVMIGAAAAGVLLIVVGLVWYWRVGLNGEIPWTRSRRHHHRHHRRRRRTTPTTQITERLGPDDDTEPVVPEPLGTRRAAEPSGGFCTQCGQPVSVGDRFCRRCGAALGESA